MDKKNTSLFSLILVLLGFFIFGCGKPPTPPPPAKDSKAVEAAEKAQRFAKKWCEGEQPASVRKTINRLMIATNTRTCLEAATHVFLRDIVSLNSLGTPLKITDFRPLADFDHLVSIDLSSNDIYSIVQLAPLFHLGKLTNLNLDGNKLSTLEGFPELFPSLEVLGVGDEPIRSSDTGALFGKSSTLRWPLKKLDLSRTLIVRFPSDLPDSLEWLGLRFVEISADSVERFRSSIHRPSRLQEIEIGTSFRERDEKVSSQLKDLFPTVKVSMPWKE